MSYHRHGYPWPSLVTPPYHSSLLAGPQGYIPYPHRDAVCRFKLVVLLLLGYMRGSIALYCHPLIHAEIYINILDTYWRNDKDAGRLLYKYMYLSLYCKGSKRLFKVCVWVGVGDRTELKYFDPHSYGRQRCVFLVLLMLNRRPWGPLCWVLAFFTASYQQLLWSPNSIGVHEGPFGRVWLSLPHLVLLLLQLCCNSNCHLTSVLTVLYNSSTLTRSPTRSLEWHDWSSSSGKNCHAVHRFSLLVHQSMSVPWEIFASSHFIHQFPPTWFPLITATRMCHFLPVHHSE